MTTPTDPHDAQDDAVLARLRAADPAARSVPDLTALRAAVDARAAAPDELAARRARRWTQWPARVAGAAAVALLVGGGGGYVLGAGAADGGAAGGPSVAMAESDTAGGGADEQTAAESAPMPDAPVDARGSGPLADDMAYPGYGGRTVFSQSGLSTEAGSAPAWAFDGAAAFDAETFGRVAAVLGVEGDVVEQDGLLAVGPQDGTGPAATLYADGGASLNFFDPTKDPWACGQERQPDPEGGDIEPCDLGPAPSGDAAFAPVRDALAAAGLDPGAFELVEEEWSEPGWTYVTAHRLVDGRRTGDAWTATLTGAGLQSLYGSLAPLVPLGDYAVVSPADAVARLGDPRFASGGPIAWAEGGLMAETPVGPAVSGPPAVPAPGGPIAWPVTQVEIVEARLVTSTHHQPGGAVLLLPTYELVDATGATWSVLAVADALLDMDS